LENRPAVSWFEAISENFMGIAGGSGGRPIHTLEKVRADYPMALHGVSLSIGSCDPLDPVYLKKLRELTRRIEPVIVSDHLCWTGVDGINLHDLLPLPYTEEALHHVVGRIRQVQEFLGRRILIENVSSYLTFRHSAMTEWDFLRAVAEEADCGLLVDINNIFVSSFNHGFDPLIYLDAIPAERVGQFHLAGHSDYGDYLLDSHDHPVRAEVWELYRKALRRFGAVSALLEWDDHIPAFAELETELAKARAIEEEELARSSHLARPAFVAKLDARGVHPAS